MKQTVAKHEMSQVSFGDSHLYSSRGAEARIQAALNWLFPGKQPLSGPQTKKSPLLQFKSCILVKSTK